MRAAVYAYTQNWWDNERFLGYEADPTDQSLANPRADNEIWQEDLRFVGLVEDLGFDELWTVEHHFSPYAQTTNSLQYLSYWAGRTKTIGMGTMVVVLPWHDPIRVAEEIIMLQYFLGERPLIIGFGRGIARREYGGFGIDASKSRQRFAEALEVVRRGVGQERFSFEGEFFTVPDMVQRKQSPHLSLRPTPLDRQRLLDNFYAAWGSPTSSTFLGALGLKPLVIPQRAMHNYSAELGEYYDAGKGHVEPANPIICQWVYCGEGPDAADRGREAHIANQACGDVNYEFSSDYLGGVPGYERYAQIGEQMQKFAAEGGDLLNDAVVGTPDECIAKIEELSDLVHPAQWNFDFKFGNLTYDEAEQSIRLFAREVLPHVHKMEVKPPLVSEGVGSS
jgi:alkanesulfonate monooxygenase SsuD/methylene tetrahydromethanopterin reductase-like flavin-dependent oxidoreductase (luciferase family)